MLHSSEKRDILSHQVHALSSVKKSTLFNEYLYKHNKCEHRECYWYVTNLDFDFFYFFIHYFK